MNRLMKIQFPGTKYTDIQAIISNQNKKSVTMSSNQ